MKNLKDLIEDHDMTQTELAEILGVHRLQVGRWINGKSEMGTEKLKKICQHFHVSADYILDLPPDLDRPR